MNLQGFAQERTEQATSRRLEKARERGQVFKSMELVSAVTLLAAAVGLEFSGPWVWAALQHLAQSTWGNLRQEDLTVAGIFTTLPRLLVTVGIAAGPVAAAVLLCGVLVQYLQVGMVFSTETLYPDLNRIDPIRGLQRLFSKRALVELLKSIAKVAVVATVAYLSIKGDLVRFVGLGGAHPLAGVLLAAQITGRVMLRVGIVMLILAVADWFYQRSEYLTHLKMTKQEVKQEHRESEGSPEVRQRIRSRQRQMARRRMMNDVAKADVVVTNPTHFAIALKYDPAAAAPQVLAKGQDFVAKRIREVARTHGVMVVENPPLARTLYATVEIGEEIPPALYQAVAEVVAVVFRTRMQ